jgi:hypothetical protein
MPMTAALAFFLTWAGFAWGQERVPRLVAWEGGQEQALSLTKVAVEARLVGHLAETRMTLTFHNPNRRALAGDLHFPLPEGATVSGYALDIGGAMVDGVVVEKDAARQAFEAEVRLGVDPGLVEMTKGSTFKTRVFPIPANGSRTIMVRYVSELTDAKEGAVYDLPLGFRDTVGELSLRVEVVRPEAPPKVADQAGLANFRFGTWRSSYVAEYLAKQAKLAGTLKIAVPRVEAGPVRLERTAEGQVYFAVADYPQEPQAMRGFTPPERIRVVWDASGSRAQADTQREAAFLARWLTQRATGPATLELVFLRDRAAAPLRFALPAERDKLLETIRSIDYDGGTNLGALRDAFGGPAPEVILLASDGLHTFGPEEIPKAPARVLAVSSSTVANHALLRQIALASGGAYANLARLDDDRAMTALGEAPFRFLGADVEGAAADLYPRLQEPVTGRFTLAGRLTGPRATLTLKYGVGDQVVATRTVSLDATEAVEGDLLARAWAGKQLDELQVMPEKNRAAIVELGKRMGLVTPGTSLIVLENLDQYLTHHIRPPASLAAMRKHYDETVERQAAERKREDEGKLAHVVELWKARVGWWETEFKVPKDFKFQSETAKSANGGAVGGAPPPPDELAEPTSVREPPREGRSEATPEAAEKSGKEKSKADEAHPEPEPAIVIKPWTPDTPYLKALTAASPESRWRGYLAQKAEFGTSPAFFLDCGDFFIRQQDRARGLQVLSNLAELALENPALLRVLAHRLAQLGEIGELDLAIVVFEEVRRLRPEEPQSFRDLALVLARRAEAKNDPADYRKALELLAHVVMNQWARFDEIELIALIELNRTLPKARAAGVADSFLDPRLIRALDLDIRIVMTWDADMTDMDLHVVEPSGEEAYYSHNRTAIGGLVSRDFTQGYGPEEYLVRRGMRGTYKVWSNFFGSSAAQLIGAVTVQVDVYTHYGRPNEQRKSLTFRLTERKDKLELGEIEL